MSQPFSCLGEEPCARRYLKRPASQRIFLDQVCLRAVRVCVRRKPLMACCSNQHMHRDSTIKCCDAQQHIFSAASRHPLPDLIMPSRSLVQQARGGALSQLTRAAQLFGSFAAMIANQGCCPSVKQVLPILVNVHFKSKPRMYWLAFFVHHISQGPKM